MSEKSKPKSRAQLAEELAAALAKIEEKTDQLRAAATAAVEDRKAINDLKVRLSDSEAYNQRMRGYIARVQEDDVVREELVTIGDREGEQQLVPKRKPTPFDAQDQYSQASVEMSARTWGNAMPPRRHWVSY